MPYGTHKNSYQGRTPVKSGGSNPWPALIAEAKAEHTNQGSKAFFVNPIDPVDRLPPVARARFLEWQEARSSSHAAYLPSSTELQEIGLDISKAQQELAHLIRSNPHIDFISTRCATATANPFPASTRQSRVGWTRSSG